MSRLMVSLLLVPEDIVLALLGIELSVLMMTETCLVKFCS